jgi:probable biosynthetic protein (TIGR04099 family)
VPFGLAPVRHETARFLPCPNNDFNGADFLYFASFQSFVDRAEWQRHRFAEPPVIASRALHFYGNVNVGDVLSVQVVGERECGQGLTHWSEVRRGSDNLKIADVVTEKRWRQR